MYIVHAKASKRKRLAKMQHCYSCTTCIALIDLGVRIHALDTPVETKPSYQSRIILLFSSIVHSPQNHYPSIQPASLHLLVANHTLAITIPSIVNICGVLLPRTTPQKPKSYKASFPQSEKAVFTKWRELPELYTAAEYLSY